jgi:thiol-disulfide isomerase/thioredoxin
MIRQEIVRIALLVLCFAVPTISPADLAPPQSRKVPPDFTLTASNASPLKLSDFKGRVILLDFWATWCHGCLEEIPWYIEFQKKYATSGLTVVGVSVDEDGWKSVKPFLQKEKVTYPVVIGDWDLAGQFGVKALPVTLLIDRSGRIADFHAGIVSKNTFEHEIQMLLKENASGTDSK